MSKDLEDLVVLKTHKYFMMLKGDMPPYLIQETKKELAVSAKDLAEGKPKQLYDLVCDYNSAMNVGNQGLMKTYSEKYHRTMDEHLEQVAPKE